MDTLTTLTILQNITIAPVSTEPPIIGKQLLQPAGLNYPDFVTLYCAQSIINAYGDQESIILYNYFDYVAQILPMESRMMFNLNKPQKLFHNRPMNFVLFIVDNIIVMRTYLENHYYTKYFNTYAKFMVIYRGVPERSIEIFEMFYSYRLSQVVVMTTEHNVYGTINKCFNQYEAPKLLFNCQSRNISSISEVYNQNVAVNGCKIRVLALPAAPYVKVTLNTYAGIAVSILKRTSRNFGFKIEYVQHNESEVGYRLSDSESRRQTKLPTYEGLLGLLEQKAGDVAVGLISSNITHTEDFCATETYIDSYYMFYMSTNTTVRQRDKTSAVFTTRTVQAYFASIACFILFIYFLIKHFKPHNAENYNKWSYVFVQFWGMGFARAVRQPLNLSTRIIFISWALFTYVFTSSYESTLTSYLMQPPEVKPLKTLESLVQLKLKPIGTDLERDTYFKNCNDPTYDAVYQRWENCSNIVRCVSKYWKLANFALFSDSRALNAQFRGVDIYMDSLPVFHHHIWMVVNKGTGFEKVLNHVIMQVQCTGLLNKWIKQNGYQYSYKAFKDKSFEPMRLIHYRATWRIFLGGIALSMLAFVVEIGYFYNWFGTIKRRVFGNNTNANNIS